MENNEHTKYQIKNLLSKLNDDDRSALCCLLIKSGYAVRIGKKRIEGKKTVMYYVEFWEEEE